MAKDVKDYGIIKYWRDSYGFIAPDGGDSDVFFHLSQILGDNEPKRGLRVSYFVAPDKRYPDKLATHDVTVLE